MKINRMNQKERGSAILEGSLVLLTFILLLLGTVDFGQVLYFHQALTDRARAAARYGAIYPTDTTGIQNMAIYNQPTTSGSPTPMIGGLTSSMIAVSNLDINTDNARVVVTISNYPIQFFSPYIAQAFNNRPIMATATAESQAP
jgi:Flp pilus assembly protein TadG